MDLCPVSVQLEGNNSALWNLVMRLLVVTSFVLGGSNALVMPPPMPHARIASQRSAAPAMLDGPTIDSSAVVALFSVGVASGAAYALAQQQADPTPTVPDLVLRGSARKHPGRPRRIRSPRMSARCAPPVMIDTNVILGGVLLVGGTAAGACGGAGGGPRDRAEGRCARRSGRLDDTRGWRTRCHRLHALGSCTSTGA